MERNWFLNWCRCVPSVKDWLDAQTTTQSLLSHRLFPFLYLLSPHFHFLSFSPPALYICALIFSYLTCHSLPTCEKPLSLNSNLHSVSHYHHFSLWPLVYSHEHVLFDFSFSCLPSYLSVGPFVFCHGVHKRWRSHVSDSASRQVQRAPCCVSTHTHRQTHKAAFADEKLRHLFMPS